MGQDHRPIREPLPGARQKTILISRNAYTWQYGGAEQFSYNLARELKQLGWRPVVITRVPELLAKCEADGIATFRNIWLRNETHRRWMLAYYALFPVLVGQYVYVLLRYRASLMLCGSRDDQIFGTMAARLSRKKIMWVDHADMKGIIAQPFRFLQRSYYWSFSRADRVVAVSQAEREKIFANLRPELKDKFNVIYNGALRHDAAPAPRPKGAVVITFIGRVEKDKGVFELAEAAALVLAKHPEVRFWIGGKGAGEEALRSQLAASGIEGRVDLLGHLSDIGPTLAASDIFVYPTHHDAAPLAPNEALLAGLPVVATRIGGIPEVIDESCGILVPAQDAKALAEALLRLVEDKAYRQKLHDGAVKRGKLFEFSYVVEHQYVPLLEEVLHG